MFEPELSFQIFIRWFLFEDLSLALPNLPSYLHHHIGPWFRAILAGRKVGSSIQSDRDSLLMTWSQVVGVRIWVLGGIQAVSCFFRNLWGEQG